jgi:AcrR family transcriptional regulator
MGRAAVQVSARPRAILAAALSLFNESGFGRTSIQDIAIRSEASVGSIYHHFGDKVGIAAALYVEGLVDYQRGLIRELTADHEDAEESVRAIVSHHLRWVEENRTMATFLLTSRDADVAAASEARLADFNESLFASVRRWTDRWADAGEIERLPLNMLHAVLLGPCQEFARHWLAGRANESIDEAERVLADAAWKAVRA